MSKASILSALPNEVLDRIFSFLSDDKHDISTCRLVCRSFSQLSSPYLITTVVFARRLRCIARLVEVVEHEYFHKYVTELIYDASFYDEERATNWDTYVQECLNAPQELEDAEWAERKLKDQNVWTTMEELEEAQTHPTQPPHPIQDGNRDGTFPYERSEEELSSEDLFGSEDEDSAESESSSSSSDYEGGALRYYDRAYRLGCHRSFPDYHRLYIAQRQMDHKGATEQMLQRVFSKLKRLKSIVFTDWRGLARYGESYNDCARRLFGNTLAPGLMPHAAYSTMLFEELMWAIEEGEDVRITQFSIGSHLFEDECCSSSPGDPRAPMFFPIPAIEFMSDVIHSLRRLDLQVNVSPGFLEGVSRDSECRIRRTLRQACNLEHLALAIRLPQSAKELVRNERLKHVVFQSWLTDQHFPHLKTMDLRGWILPHASLESFLARHATTLREVHFINCHLIGHQVPLATWAGNNLKLHGIEISLTPGAHVYYLELLADSTLKRIPVETAFIPDHELLWLAGRQNHIVRRPFLGRLQDDVLPQRRIPWWMKRGREESEAVR